MTDSSVKDVLRARLDAVEERLRAACARAGRPRMDVTLVAVTKTVPVAVAALLPELGVVDLGENRPQELWTKAAALPSEIRWHLIGHLQRNKIERTLPKVQLFHSIDSARLLTALEETAVRLGTARVLIEVNASREAAKGGFAPEDLPGLIPQINALKHVEVCGLMTMAAFEPDPERCRPTFQELRNLRERYRAELRPPHVLDHLSMGMTNDFEVAVEEGATFVRIGSALFEGLPA